MLRVKIPFPTLEEDIRQTDSPAKKLTCFVIHAEKEGRREGRKRGRERKEGREEGGERKERERKRKNEKEK